MGYAPIKKDVNKTHRPANMLSYQHSYDNFKWHKAKAMIRGYKGGINMGYEAADRHVDDGFGSQEALIFLDQKKTRKALSYTQLQQMSNRFANLLKSVNVEKGDLLCSLTDRTPILYAAVIGCLKSAVVFSPLFSAFGSEPIKARMTIGGAVALLTSGKLYKKKIAAWRNECPSLKTVLLYECEGECPSDCIDLDQTLETQSDLFNIYATDPEDKALIHFTSGTTGTPKAVVHVHDAVIYHKYSGYYALDIHPQDVYWCTADPGWVTGISYGVISPLCNRATLIVDNAEYDANRWYSILEQEHVNIWYTAPTAIRMLMKAGNELCEQYDLSALRFLASVGEPLNPEAVVWSQKHLGNVFHDNWWQTETGGIMLANFMSEDVRPGSMGRPLPGIQAGIVRVDEQGHLVELSKPNETGELAFKKGWPSMFRDYLHESKRYQACFNGDWYLSGDLAYKDQDGYFWFVGRRSDLIKSSGHLIGPFEIESVLLEHPAVAEAGVVGVPDAIAGELVKAFIALKDGYEDDPALRKSIMAHARKKLGSALAPREISVKQNLPKTRSGKIMRRLLKARELGLPEGDISTLESD
ncbi:acetate--CoA ligase [Brumicola nitratireducens]|uniref:acetate--CoA ligase n=1 Tax=Glaciecola nitratireducens (strain JCM 12485 / KCTC 12276 / FR1064) TaxID=1085623 RepID=G4QML4_GLANF|nr:acetate--CoA ligase [Glaciecola nitratireducens]AEP30966.1 acetyl-CoA synthetase [Glaciecola nitratireducens FR1064]